MQVDRKSIAQQSFKLEEYGCLMVKFNIPWWDKFVSNIKKDDIYDHEGYGVEYEPHITVLYGFKDEVTSDIMKTYIKRLPVTISIILTDVSSFDSNNYDVLKLDVNSTSLHKLNSFFKILPHVDTHPVYHPHMTIAYLKPGRAKKYMTKLAKPIQLLSHTFSFSDKFGNKTQFD